MHTVAVDVAKCAIIKRAEGLQPIGRGLDHITCSVDLVVEHGEHASATCFG